jgi:hypothetical protein
MKTWHLVPRNLSLASITSGAAALLGLLLLVSGIGLTIAVLTTSQGVLQFMTALVLMLSGGVNLRVSRSIGRRETKAMTTSAAATISLTVYLVLTSNSSELVAVQQLYLLVLFALACRVRAASIHTSA